MNSLASYLKQQQEHVNQILEAQLNSLPNSQLKEAMVYSVLNGGKRLRPILVYATGEALGAPSEILDIPACAIELIHCFSLIHDDLPAMDDDDLRRDKPTCHKAFNEALAILAGDALQTFSFELLSKAPSLSDQQRIEMIRFLASACGATGMGYGQSLDIENKNDLSLEELTTIHERKTGALLNASIQLALIAADCKQKKRIEALTQFAKHIGLAFQIYDDILDIEGNTKTLGKPSGSDDKQQKPTYPTIMGLTLAKQEVTKLFQQAMNHLKSVGFEETRLAEIAHFIVNRIY